MNSGIRRPIMGQTASRVPGSLSGFDGKRHLPGVQKESAHHAGVGARVSFFYHLPATLGGQVRQSVTESCLVGAIPIRMSWERVRFDPYVELVVGMPA